MQGGLSFGAGAARSVLTAGKEGADGADVAVAGPEAEVMGQVGLLLQLGGELVDAMDEHLAHTLVEDLIGNGGASAGVGSGSARTPLGRAVLGYALRQDWISHDGGVDVDTGEVQVRYSLPHALPATASASASSAASRAESDDGDAGADRGDTPALELGWSKIPVREGRPEYIAKRGDMVKVHYVAKLKEKNDELDNSNKRKRPVSFQLGASPGNSTAVIRGWDEGIEGMALGEKVWLDVTSSAAYVERTDAVLESVRPGVDLRFEIELVAVNGVSIEEAVEIAAAAPANTAPDEEQRADRPPRRQAKKPPMFERMPPDPAQFVRTECARALGVVLQHRIRARDGERLACATVAAMTQDLVAESAHLLERLAPADARAFIQHAMYPENHEQGEGEGRDEDPSAALRKHLRAAVTSAAAADGGAGSEREEAGARGLGRWLQAEAVGVSLVTSLVQVRSRVKLNMENRENTH